MTATKRFRNVLSEEMVEQILGKLHCPKTILRCTSVCKSWRSLIKSSKFINTHLSHPNETKYLLCESDKVFTLYSDSEPSKKCCRLVFPNRPRRVQIHGCCNGVICYTKLPGNQDIVYIWNPSIRKLKVLPESQKPGHESQKRGHVNNAIGLWFNAEKNEYEVAKIGYTRSISFVQVYSQGSNSWKMISETCPGALRIRDHNLVYVKGTLHWLAERKQGWIIVSLDMDTAKLRERLISHPCLEVNKFYLTRAHADILAILRSRWNSSGYKQNGCTIEVYDENLTTVSMDLDDNRGENLFLLGFRNNGEAVLLKMPNADRMLSYDFATKQLKDLGFLDQNSSLESALPFVNSLVLINDGDVQTTTPPVLGKKFV